jgi:hypothetical protein
MECVIFTCRTKREEEPEGQRKRGDGFGVETSQMVKGTVVRDFTALVFLPKVSIFGPDSFPKFFLICFKFAELFEFEV